MAVNLDALFSNKAFATVDSERLRLFKQFAREIEGKSTHEIVSQFMKMNQAVGKIKPITADERKAIAGAVYDSLPETDKPKFNSMLKLLNISV